jgi:hypothetical protein
LKENLVLVDYGDGETGQVATSGGLGQRTIEFEPSRVLLACG